MAGDWIKLEHVTPDKPEVVAIAEALGIDQDAVTGKLVRLWIWADQQTFDGASNCNGFGVTKNWIDRETRVTGFANAMLDVGWLEVDTDKKGGAVRFPRFERHNGITAKTRSETYRRVKKHRDEKCNAKSVTKALQSTKKSKSKNITPEGVIDATQADDSKPAEVVDLAERIYLAYPRHVGRAAAIKAIRLAFAKIDGAALLALVESYASARRGADPQFTPHPATWFNQGRWADDPNEWSVNNGNSGGSAARPASANREQDRIARNVGALADFVAAHEGNRTSGVRQGALLFDRGEANGGPDP